MKTRWTLHLELDDRDRVPPVCKVKRILKALWRTHGCKCTAAIEGTDGATTPSDATTGKDGASAGKREGGA